MLKIFRKEHLYKFLLVLVGFGMIGLLEAGLRVFGVASNYNFVIQKTSSSGVEKYALNTQYIALHYFQHLPIDMTKLLLEKPWFADTVFSVDKPADVYRIFFVGASTTRGFPFQYRRTSYPGIFASVIKDVLPSRRVEVINAGYDALSSFGVLDVTRQILDYDPDLVVVYSGHNEFIGHFGVNSTVNYGQSRFLANLVTRLYQSRIFTLGELLALKLRSRNKPKVASDSGFNMFDAMLDDDKFTWDEESHAIAEKNFEANLVEIARLAKEKKTSLVFSTLVSNLKDFSPVLSEFSSSTGPGERKIIKDHLMKGREYFESGALENSIEQFESAVGIDPAYAVAHYELGRAYEESMEFLEARDEYILARENDKLHLRACLRLNNVIREVGRRENVPVFDMVQAFEEMSPNGLVGKNMFLEHVHPDINGHLALAASFADQLSRSWMIEPPDKWDMSRLRKGNDYLHSIRFTKSQYNSARLNVGQLLLEFPFFKCEEGSEMLKSVGMDKKKSKSIADCYKTVRASTSDIPTKTE